MPPSATTNLSENDWDTIIDNIKTGKTIICLGAELFSTEISITEQLKSFLDVEKKSDVKAYDDGLFYFAGSDIKFYTQIKKFYEKEFPHVEEIYNKISQIKLPLFLSLNPDHKLKEAFDKSNILCSYEYYYQKNPANNVDNPTIERPLIYNLLGDISKRESIILTYNNLFDYFESIVLGKSMPENIKEIIHDAYNLIFLGIPFDKWYMQILLRVMKQHINFQASKFAANKINNEAVTSLCLDHFNITCVPSKIEEFVDQLFERCQNENLLREIIIKNNNVLKQKYTQLLNNDKLIEAAEMLFNYFEKSLDFENKNICTHLLSILNSLNYRKKIGILNESDNEWKTERAKIRQTLLEFQNINFLEKD